MRHMRIGVVQMMPHLGDASANIAAMRGFMERAAAEGCDLACFPEACITGYSTAQASEVALAADDARLSELEGCAYELGIAVSYGYIERYDGELHIAHVVSGREGHLVYRKTHLGSRERGVFAMGNELPVAVVDGVCVGVQLCWEANIPDITTVYRTKGAELVLMPYASGASGARRRETWERVLPARASDNGIYVAACNLLGKSGGGGIAVFDPKGRVLASHYEPGEALVVCDFFSELPRNGSGDDMHNISYFDRRRPELYGAL